MFAKRVNTVDRRLLVRVVTPDPALARRIRAALPPDKGFEIEVVESSLREANGALHRNGCSLLIVDIDQNSKDLDLLETDFRRSPAPPAAIIVSDGLSDTSVRRLLKLQISDWLPRGCTEREIVLACDHAVRTTADG